MKVYCDKCKFVSTWEGRDSTHYECKANRTPIGRRFGDGRIIMHNGNAEKININHDCPKFQKRLLPYFSFSQWGFGIVLFGIFGSMFMVLSILSWILTGNPFEWVRQ